jgi:predicted Zn-dependent protease
MLPVFRHFRHLALVLALAVAVPACATNPVTGRREIALIGEGQEIAMGREAAEDVERSIGLVNDAALQQYVQRLGSQLAGDSERPNLPWHFRVVDDPTPNAFALPGGFIYVTRGLLTLLTSEAELASVLGHEVGHVTARHSVQMISRAQLTQLGLGLGMILVPELQQFGQLAGVGMQLMFLRYGRDAEHQADDLGFRYALEEGYDVREMANVFAALARVGEMENRSPLPAWMSTHPYPEERIERTRARVAAVEQNFATLRIGSADYLNRLNGIMYGINPRNGFFEGAQYFHPELRFRMSIPGGWQAQNLPQMVVAVSPNEDAVAQLTLAAGTVEAAAQQFLGQQGITVGQTSRTQINGLPALVSFFRAQTQQGALAGIVAFVSHDGRTYRLLTYTPEPRLGSYDAVFRTFLSSFAVLTDSRILNVQPNRVQVVRLDQAMTLQAFNQRYPSVIPIGELALINQVASPGETIPAGTVLKRVVGG